MLQNRYVCYNWNRNKRRTAIPINYSSPQIHSSCWRRCDVSHHSFPRFAGSRLPSHTRWSKRQGHPGGDKASGNTGHMYATATDLALPKTGDLGEGILEILLELPTTEPNNPVKMTRVLTDRKGASYTPPWPSPLPCGALAADENQGKTAKEPKGKQKARCLTTPSTQPHPLLSPDVRLPVRERSRLASSWPVECVTPQLPQGGSSPYQCPEVPRRRWWLIDKTRRRWCRA